MLKKRKLDDVDIYYFIRYSDGIKFFEEIVDQLRLNDVEECYYFRKKRVGSYFIEIYLFGKLLSYGILNEDEIFICKQSFDIG